MAEKYGIDYDSLSAPNFETRLEKLRKILQDKDVDYPIPTDVAAAYFAKMEQGEPFKIGTLSDKRVDLEQYKNTQVYDDYPKEDHLSWAILCEKQHGTKDEHACEEYLYGEITFAIGDKIIPDYYLLNARIYQQTGWQLATVEEIIPADLFFACHSNCFFPVTTFVRGIDVDYLEEPDIGHDIAGHVSTFTIPAVANIMQSHGKARDMILAELEEAYAKIENNPQQPFLKSSMKKAAAEKAARLLDYAGRLYWFTVEFGLVMQDEKPKAFGAGILSSPGETEFSIESSTPSRVIINPSNDRDLLRLTCTKFLISKFQETYFMMTSFDELNSLTPERILAAVKAADKRTHYSWKDLVPGDVVHNVGKNQTSPEQKYLRFANGQPLDTAELEILHRNLYHAGKGHIQTGWDNLTAGMHLHTEFSAEEEFNKRNFPTAPKEVEYREVSDEILGEIPPDLKLTIPEKPCIPPGVPRAKINTH